MIAGLLIGLLSGGALGMLAGAGVRARTTPSTSTSDAPPAEGVPFEGSLEHPPSCFCGGRGRTDEGKPCPVLWRIPAERVRLVGRLPRGSQR